MKTCIINCAEYSNLLDTIESFVSKGEWEVKKIIDYTEYKNKYKNFDAEFESFYDHIRLKKLCNKSRQYHYISKESIIFAEKHIKSAIDILKIRHVKNGISFNDDEANILFYDSLNRSLSEIEDMKIDLILFNHIPHHFNTYILYVAAKYLGIKTLIVTKLSWNGFRYFLDTSIGERGWSVKKDIKCCNEVILNDRAYYYEIKNRSHYLKPIYMVRKYKRRIVSMLAIIFNNNIFFHMAIAIYGGSEIGLFKRMPCHFKWNNNKLYTKENYPLKFFQVISQINSIIRISKLAKIYERLSSKINFNINRYVLFAPNYQPEATTLPTSLYFYDVLFCIKLLRSRLPDDILIIYKEHEDIFNITLEGDRCRSQEFYENVLQINNVLIAGRSESQVKLIDNSQFVVIQTSNIGLESLIRGKTVVNFGATWFDDFPGMTNWDDFDTPNGYNKLLSKIFEVDIEKISEINKYTVNLESKIKTEDTIFKMELLFRRALKII